MKNKLFWIGAFAYFVADLITTAIGLYLGAQELNPFIKTLPFMAMAKAGVLIFLFGVLKYFEYLEIKSEHKMIVHSSIILRNFIIAFVGFVGIGIGVINNIIVIGSMI